MSGFSFKNVQELGSQIPEDMVDMRDMVHSVDMLDIMDMLDRLMLGFAHKKTEAWKVFFFSPHLHGFRLKIFKDLFKILLQKSESFSNRKNACLQLIFYDIFVCQEWWWLISSTLLN